MGSGKRASMREGPLAALFRKTETDGLPPVSPRAEAPPEPAAAPSPAPAAETPAPRPEPVRRAPTPQERLRHAFSSDIPDNMMAPPHEEWSSSPSSFGLARADGPARSCASSASAAPASTRSTA